jgi:endonuclease/exonuclease/phosphatase family metal-dependent hydrolase
VRHSVLVRFALGLAVIGAAGVLTGACSDQSIVPTPPPGVGVAVDGGGVAVDGGGGADGDPAPAADGGTQRPGVIRVAQFNVRRFFNTVCDSGKCASGDFEDLPTQAEFDAKTDALAKGIALIDPDIIALEEVETQGCLDALNAKLATMGKGFPIAHLGETGSQGSVDVAVLARGTLTEVKTHRDVPLTEADGTMTTFTRELLEVRMTFGARSVVMFAAHFRSQVMDDPARRLAEAKGAQAIVAKTSTDLPDSLVILGGDLNDKPGSDAINAMEAGGALLRVASDIPADAQGTYIFNGVKNAIDHIFVGAPQASRYVPTSSIVYSDSAKGGFSSSDHASLAAEFSIQ